MGNTLCCKRERKPIYSKVNLALADLFLYQVCNVAIFSDDLSYYNCWFPRCYVYCEKANNGWEKLISKRYCRSMCTLFGASSIEELKNVITPCTFNREIRYSGAFFSAPAILNYVKLEEIGTMG